MARTHRDHYVQTQMQDAELKRLTEAERAPLEIGHRFATLRRGHKLSRAQVAATLTMSLVRTIGRVTA